jgi:hypothetical protein
MNVEQFFHVIRSAARVSGAREITVFGTSAAIPWIKRGAEELWPSMEVDLDAGSEDANTEIEGALGELSDFHVTHGIYAQASSIEHFKAPPRWKARSKIVVEPVTKVRVRVPRPLDIATAKLVRGDEKDWDFAGYAVRCLKVKLADIEKALDEVALAHPPYKTACELARGLLRTKLRSDPPAKYRRRS